MKSASTIRFGHVALCVALSATALSACSKKAAEEPAAGETAAATPEAATTNAPTEAAAPAATASAAAPAPDNVDTLSGVKFAGYTGAAKGKTAFITCQTCHTVEAGVNKIGPSLHEVVGRAAGTVAGYTYSAANKNSGITWTPEKLFQYLEKPQRVVPGTKMAFPGIPDPQKRADVIAYLQAGG
ncbi:cytochrome c family protein [Sphingomonas aerolata]|uniref:c-type cytochrome n=1 Tax=Sphingomonas aerolata TaxID=185951 RepID=UPI002FE2483E